MVSAMRQAAKPYRYFCSLDHRFVMTILVVALAALCARQASAQTNASAPVTPSTFSGDLSTLPKDNGGPPGAAGASDQLEQPAQPAPACRFARSGLAEEPERHTGSRRHSAAVYYSEPKLRHLRWWRRAAGCQRCRRTEPLHYDGEFHLSDFR